MIMSPAIEYLLTLLSPSGGRLVSQEATQLLIPIFPPGATLAFSAGPLASDYGQIVYGLGVGPNVVPNTFIGYVQFWGGRQVTGTFTTALLVTEFQLFVWVTQAEPSLVYVRNVSGLSQIFEVDYVSIRITSEDDYNTVIDALRHRATSSESESLAKEANRLLRIMAGQPEAPVGSS